MAVVLDAGALIAIESADPAVLGLVLVARKGGVAIRTSSAAVAQVWRDGSRQVLLSRSLRGVEELPIDHELSRRIGELLGRAGCSDVVDAAVVLASGSGDRILTSDPADLAHLADAAGLQVDIVTV